MFLYLHENLVIYISEITANDVKNTNDFDKMIKKLDKK